MVRRKANKERKSLGGKLTETFGGEPLRHNAAFGWQPCRPGHTTGIMLSSRLALLRTGGRAVGSRPEISRLFCRACWAPTDCRLQEERKHGANESLSRLNPVRVLEISGEDTRQ